MEIHNLMEDLVLKTVEEICEEEGKKSGGTYCTSDQCRLDVACFVLNRVPQQYVSSGRGAAHAEKSLKENPQLMVDVVTLVHEGLKRVSHVQRPYYDKPGTESLPKGPAFCFPTIKGRLLNGTTFEPAHNAAVSLRMGGEPVAMIDGRWQNPFVLDPKIEGTFLFLPRPVEAVRQDEERTFELEVFVEDRVFEVFHHFFKITLTAEAEVDLMARKSVNYKLPDLYLVPK